MSELPQISFLMLSLKAINTTINNKINAQEILKIIIMATIFKTKQRKREKKVVLRKVDINQVMSLMRVFLVYADRLPLILFSCCFMSST